MASINTLLKAGAAAFAIATGAGALPEQAQAQNYGYNKGYNGDQRLYTSDLRLVDYEYRANLANCRGAQFISCSAGAQSVRLRQVFEVSYRYGRATQRMADEAYSQRTRAIGLQRTYNMAVCFQRRDYRSSARCQRTAEQRFVSDTRSAETWYSNALRRLSRR